MKTKVLLSGVDAGTVVLDKKKLIAYIDECDQFLLYTTEIKKSITMLPSGCYFKLPSANTDWAIEIFRLIHFLCYTWKDKFFVVSDDGDKAGFIYLYIHNGL